ncbi:MAG: hypothetical protein ACLPVF_19640 [Acidimicrobiales bacterium]
MPGGRWRAPRVAVLLVFACGLSACGGRFGIPPDSTAAARLHHHGSAPLAATESKAASTRGAGPSGGEAGSAGPPGHGATDLAPAPGTTITTTAEVTAAYESYLGDLSGLDDTLNQSYIGPLASVTTTRLAQASVRQAAAILAAHEHAVGTLRDDHVAITMTGPSSAALVDCQDEQDFYLVSDGTGTPDPFVGRGDFVGSAQLLLQNGHWLVDTFTTTHLPCSY